MSAAPTPGPFTDKMDVFGGNRLFIYGADGQAVAEVFASVKIPYLEQKANARLIAAAPELLAALKDALYCLETVAKNEGFDTSLGVVPQARAAIAKAEGAR